MRNRFQPIRTAEGGLVYDRKANEPYDAADSYEAAVELAAELNDLTNGVYSYRSQDFLLSVREREKASELSTSELSTSELSNPRGLVLA